MASELTLRVWGAPRQVKAIESEFQQAKQDDGSRLYQLLCHLTPPPPAAAAGAPSDGQSGERATRSGRKQRAAAASGGERAAASGARGDGHSAAPAATHPYNRFTWGNRRSLEELPAEMGADMRTCVCCSRAVGRPLGGDARLASFSLLIQTSRDAVAGSSLVLAGRCVPSTAATTPRA